MAKEPSREEVAANNRHQVEEALGDDNKYFAGLFFGREATREELIFYYIEHGGAVGHRQRVEQRRTETNESSDS